MSKFQLKMKTSESRNAIATHEPGTFTPMVKLSATKQGPYRKEPTAMERAATFSDNEQQALAGLAIMRKAERDLLEASMGEFMKTGLPPATAALLGPEIAAQMNKMLASMAQAQADERAAQSANVQIHFYHCDHLGTPLALTDRRGKVVWAIRLDPFGKELAEFNPNGIEQNIRLPGQYLDRETGLHYNRHRYYDPSIGAYITQDPIGLRGGLNFYGYVFHSPQSFIDPLGLDGGASAGVDVIAAVWSAAPLSRSVGHVYLADMNGNTLTSQFPVPSGLIGPNVTKNWEQTLQAEGRPPDGIYKIHVPNADGLNSQAEIERNKPKWAMLPSSSQSTNCTIAADRVLEAAGKPFLVNPGTPSAFLNEIDSQAKIIGSGVQKISSVPWIN